MISFTIAGTTYQAESGMTWFEWVNSEYNTERYIVDSSGHCSYVGENGWTYSISGAPSNGPVYISDSIVGGYSYVHYTEK